MVTPSTGSDEVLMGRARDGDREAFSALFDRYVAPLHAFLSRMTGDSALAEDLVQDSFWRVWAHRSSYRTGSRFATWLYSIARHAALNALKRSSWGEIRFSECPGIEECSISR